MQQSEITSTTIKQSSSTFIIIVFGLPASGKSTFTCYLKQYVFNQALLISADNIQLQIQSNQHLISKLSQLQNQQLIKQLRKIETNKTSINSKPQFNADNWKRSRKLIECIVQKLAKTCSIILDDDFLLRSQRKVFRKISFIAKIKYIQIFMDSSLMQCLSNLQCRNLKNKNEVVTEEIVRKSAQKIQIQLESEYTMKISQKERQNVTRSQIIKRMKIVQIKPNDPNDPDFCQQKQKYQHTAQQVIQIEVRRFVNSMMNLNSSNLDLKFESNMVKKYELNNKKVFSGLLNEWKKIYVHSKEKSSKQQQMQQSFKAYLQKKYQTIQKQV